MPSLIGIPAFRGPVQLRTMNNTFMCEAKFFTPGG